MDHIGLSVRSSVRSKWPYSRKLLFAYLLARAGRLRHSGTGGKAHQQSRDYFHFLSLRKVGDARTAQSLPSIAASGPGRSRRGHLNRNIVQSALPFDRKFDDRPNPGKTTLLRNCDALRTGIPSAATTTSPFRTPAASAGEALATSAIMAPSVRRVRWVADRS